MFPKDNFLTKLLIIIFFILISFSIGIYNKAHLLTSTQQFNHIAEAISIAIKEIKTGSEGYIGFKINVNLEGIVW